MHGASFTAVEFRCERTSSLPTEFKTFLPRFARRVRWFSLVNSWPVSWRCRVRQLISEPSFTRRGRGSRVEFPLGFSQSVVLTRDAQPFNQPDKQRRATFARFGQRRAAVVRRLSQTLGLTRVLSAVRPSNPLFHVRCGASRFGEYGAFPRHPMFRFG